MEKIIKASTQSQYGHDKENGNCSRIVQERKLHSAAQLKFQGSPTYRSPAKDFDVREGGLQNDVVGPHPDTWVSRNWVQGLGFKV